MRLGGYDCTMGGDMVAFAFASSPCFTAKCFWDVMLKDLLLLIPSVVIVHFRQCITYSRVTNN